jgi:protocatechuate 3,4-dioxygenase beta subunit
VDAADDPANGEPAGDYLIRVISSTMDGTNRWYVAGNSAGTTVKADATPVALHSGAAPLAITMVMPAIAKVTGTVQDNHGTPVAGATVFRSMSGQSASTVTQADGSYSFGYVRAGAHSLSVNPVGDYAGTSGSMTVPASGDYVAPLLVVQKAAAIHGTVVDSVTGDPIPMVNVEVYTAGTHNYVGSAYTDLAGNYRINQLGNQSLVARYTHEFGGYARKLYGGGDPADWSGEVPFVLNPEEDRVLDTDLTAVALDPPPEHNLSGTVTDAAGDPLAGILVDAPGLTGDETDRLGHWYINAPAGTYRLRASDAGGLWSNRLFGTEPGWFPEYYPDASSVAAGTPVTVGAGLTHDNLDVTLDRGAFIKGTVRDEGDGMTTNFGTHWSVYGPNGQVALEQDPGYFSGASYSAPGDLAAAAQVAALRRVLGRRLPPALGRRRGLVRGGDARHRGRRGDAHRRRHPRRHVARRDHPSRGQRHPGCGGCAHGEHRDLDHHDADPLRHDVVARSHPGRVRTVVRGGGGRRREHAPGPGRGDQREPHRDGVVGTRDHRPAGVGRGRPWGLAEARRRQADHRGECHRGDTDRDPDRQARREGREERCRAGRWPRRGQAEAAAVGVPSLHGLLQRLGPALGLVGRREGTGALVPVDQGRRRLQLGLKSDASRAQVVAATLGP